jgi:glutathione-regulated potassium-efflux system ancillary protein KefC
VSAHADDWIANTILFHTGRAGYLVSVPAIVAAPAAFLFLLMVEAATKIARVYPVARYFGSPRKVAIYTTLLMSTGLTFGTIASLFGLGLSTKANIPAW